jgi:hypothetical protein
MLSPNRRLFFLALLQLLLCWYETYLISKISTIGKIGIATAYHQYHWLRIFWLTFTILTLFQLGLIVALYIIGKRATKKMTNLVSTILLVAGGLGLVLTFQDFIHTYGHRLLKERFHLGFYIFWISWIGSCIFFLFTPAPHPAPQLVPYRPEVAQDSLSPDPNAPNAQPYTKEGSPASTNPTATPTTS